MLQYFFSIDRSKFHAGKWEQQKSTMQEKRRETNNLKRRAKYRGICGMLNCCIFISSFDSNHSRDPVEIFRIYLKDRCFIRAGYFSRLIKQWNAYSCLQFPDNSLHLIITFVINGWIFASRILFDGILQNWALIYSILFTSCW